MTDGEDVLRDGRISHLNVDRFIRATAKIYFAVTPGGFFKQDKLATCFWLAFLQKLDGRLLTQKFLFPAFFSGFTPSRRSRFNHAARGELCVFSFPASESFV